MSTPRDWSQNTVLVVDDDPLQRELMKMALADFNLQILEAENGAEALEQFRQHHPILVVMDIQMPVMDGYTSCAAMKALPGAEDAAILLITGSDDLSALEAAYDAGAIEFISKPLDWPLFQMRIKYIIRIQKTYLKVSQSKEKLAWAQQAAGVGTWDFDSQTMNVDLSPVALSVLNLGPEYAQVSYSELLTVAKPLEKQALVDAYLNLVKNSEPLDMDLHLSCPGGHDIIAHLHCEEMVPDREGKVALCGTVQDISAQRIAAEKIREAAEAKNQFLANISHEMRTPINGMLGMTDLLEKSPLNEDQSQWVEIIQESGTHLQLVIDGILSFARIESGDLRIECTPFSLNRIILSTVALMGPSIEKKKLTMKVEVDEKIPDQLQGDAGRIKQILLNLLGNALKFTDQGEISLAVSGSALDAKKIQVRFSVSDTGIGIPLEKQSLVFDHFTQVDGSLTRKYEGTGLGLSISRDLIRKMGGEIGLTSREGEGSEFWFELPLAASHPEPIDSPDSAPTTDSSLQDNLSVPILLVDDNAINRLFTKKILERLGFTVGVAANGVEALKMVQSGSYGTVFMDCQMPVMDGYEATRQIRKLGGEYEDLPIIALTAHTLAGDREKCLAAGMSDYLPKPVGSEDLAEMIGRWLREGELTG